MDLCASDRFFIDLIGKLRWVEVVENIFQFEADHFKGGKGLLLVGKGALNFSDFLFW